MADPYAVRCPSCGAGKGRPCRKLIMEMAGGLPTLYPRAKGPAVEVPHLSRRLGATAA